MLTNLRRLDLALRIAGGAQSGGLYALLRIARALLRILRSRRHTLDPARGGALLLRARGGLLARGLRGGRCGGLCVRGRGGSGGVVLAHDGREVERFHLRRLIPGVLAGGALQRTAFLA